KEPSTRDIQKFIQPLADNLAELSTKGVWISKTHKYPHGRRVRVVVPITSMDSLASCAFSGFAPHSHTCFCRVCSATLSQLSHPNLLPFKLRDMETHRHLASSWENATLLDQQEHLYSMHGVRSSQWLRFPWWDAVIGSPIGPLH
ncbi:hypothetical protein BDV93DRAFT_425169, partial [Ceratobasidium sp. AG-I]